MSFVYGVGNSLRSNVLGLSTIAMFPCKSISARRVLPNLEAGVLTPFFLFLLAFGPGVQEYPGPKLTSEDFYGRVVGRKFIVHKEPKHFHVLLGGFGIDENRLFKLRDSGVSKVLIYYHLEPGVTEVYHATIEQWLNSPKFSNKKGAWGAAVQRILKLDECVPS